MSRAGQVSGGNASVARFPIEATSGYIARKQSQ